MQTRPGHGRAQGAATATAETSSSVAPTTDSAPDPLIGELIDGRYQVEKLLGAGGQGDVYLATDKVLGCHRVLKFLKAAYVDVEDMRRRLAREARIAASLDSPYLVPVLDVSMESKPPYLVMPYCDGGSLSQEVVRLGRLSYASTKRYLEHIAAALATAHHQGYVHRDLKPANVLLTYDPGTRQMRARLLDFGTARDLQVDMTQITEQGHLVGTLGYLAPEFLTTTDAELVPAADVFAVGQIAHILLTGQKPRRRSAVEWAAHYAALGEEARKHQTTARGREPLASVALPGNEYLPPAFCDVIDRCLSLDPNERYEDGAELYDALRRVERLASAKPGTIVDRRYELVEKLGEGGQAVVWEARSLETQSSVAIKMMLPSEEYSQEQRDYLLSRFQREMDVLMQLRHPGVVQVLGQGRVGGDPYIVLERLSGSPLSKIHAELDWKTTCEIVTELASALQAAHNAGVVHRDLKGENIIITGDGRVVLIDFGIARIPDSQLTGTARLGTPGATAPEQHTRRPDDVGPAADQWALGAMVYRLLTGMVPGEQHPGELRHVAENDVAQQLQQATVVAFAECIPDLEPEVATALERAMAYDPSLRFPDVQTFASALSGTSHLDVSLYASDGRISGVTITPHATTERVAAAQHVYVRSGLRRWVAGTLALALLGIAAVVAMKLGTGDGDGSMKATTPAPVSPDAGTETTGERSPPAQTIDARPAPKLVLESLTLKTTRRGKELNGVRLLIDGEVKSSPAVVERKAGATVITTVVDRRFKETRTKVVMPSGGDTIKIHLERASRSRRRGPTKKPTDPKPPRDDLPDIIDMPGGKKTP